MNITIPIIAGTLASMIHVISGPDHLAAVTPLIIETKRKTWKIGFFWGLGHLLGMLLIGSLFFLFKDLIPVDTISKYSEQLVAVVLIGVGVWSFYRIFIEKKQQVHSHTNNKVLKHSIFSALSIGFLHGLAGVAHFLLLLPILGFKNSFESGQYIIGFSIGTILAMSIYSLILGKLATYSKQQYNNTLFKIIRFSGGSFAIIIGIYWFFLSL